MTGANYISKFLVNLGITDVFGVPGGVVLDLLEALHFNESICVHLCYNEQSACFAAIGYAQSSNKIGVCYCTKGPGITNMVTAISDAYYDSVPVIIFTGHGKHTKYGTRCDFDQEMDLASLLSTICKKVYIVDKPEELLDALNDSVETAYAGRKGPVVIDVCSDVYKASSFSDSYYARNTVLGEYNCAEAVFETINKELESSCYPVFLIGDGIKQAGCRDKYLKWLSSIQIPILSSRYVVDVLSCLDNYCGYIGSHGCRASNIVLSKADLIISIGNRLSVPLDSKSFSSIVAKRIIRIDIDDAEFKRSFPNSLNYVCDVKYIPDSPKCLLVSEDHKKWNDTCKRIKKTLIEYDSNKVVKDISLFLKSSDNLNVVCDVGNNEFWASYAFYSSMIKNNLFFSKSFGALGNSLGKSIGAFYGNKKKTVVIVGDQGFQFNIQELETIAKEKLPISIFIVNNMSSGMIRTAQKRKFNSKFIHTTFESGYSNPSFSLIAKAYGFNYFLNIFSKIDFEKMNIIEMTYDESLDLIPYLESGHECDDLSPSLNESTKKAINKILGDAYE